MHRIVSSALAVVWASLGSCTSPTCDAALVSFYSAPSDNWSSNLAALPSEQRFNVYVCGIKHMHPRPLGLAAAIAKEGGSTEEDMIRHLRSSSDSDELVAAANVLVEYGRLHPQTVCRSGEIEKALNVGKEKIQDRAARQYFAEISSRFCSEFR